MERYDFEQYIGKTFAEVVEMGKHDGIEWVKGQEENDICCGTIEAPNYRHPELGEVYFLVENGKVREWDWCGG